MKKIFYGATMLILTGVVAFCFVGCNIADISNATNSATEANVSNSNIAYYFPRDGQPPEPALVKVIDSANSTLDIAIYSITDTNIASAVKAAKDRGVNVRMISDNEESANKSQKTLLQSLKSDNIPIKINTHTGLMHLKVTIVDNQTVTTGSFNYSKNAENNNDEVFVVIHDTASAVSFDNEFTRMWNDTSGFVNY